MASIGGPDIVQSGLVAVFDAGSTRSYPGSGTTWFDLSGNGNNGTLTSASIGTTASGAMTFDGVDDKINITSINLASSDFTVIGVTKRTGGSGRLISALNNWLLGQWGGGDYYQYSVGWVSQNTTSDVGVTHMHCVTGNISADVYKYLNDNVDYTTSAAGGSAGPNSFSLGNSNGGEFCEGTITVLLVYNRVLTDAEINQNFNAQKNRFL